jgi:hypothetical protein
MIVPSSPGPGRSTSEAAVNQLKRQIARRNDEAQKAGRRKCTAREKERLANLRKRERVYNRARDEPLHAPVCS